MAGVTRRERRAYRRRVVERWRTNLATHVRTQIAVGTAVGVVGGLLALVAGQEVASLLFALGAAVLWVLLAGCFFLLRAPAELDHDASAAIAGAEAERDRARAARDAAMRRVEPARIRVEVLDPVPRGDNSLLRLRVYNLEPVGTSATLEAEVVGLVGASEFPPEVPWHVFWRHTHGEYVKRINGGTSEIIDFASTLNVDIAAALVRWSEFRPPFIFTVIGAEGSDPIGNTAYAAGHESMSFDEYAEAELISTLRIVHQEAAGGIL